MKLARAVTAILLLATLLQSALANQAPNPTSLPQALYPRLAGSLPEVEAAVLRALQQTGNTGRLIQVAADTNEQLTIVSLVFTYTAAVPDPVPAVQASAWTLARTALNAAGTLDEVHLTAFHQGGGLFDADRADATFTAAISRQELAALKGLPPSQALRSLPRVWYHPLLLQTDLAALEAHRRAEPTRVADLERPPSFKGSVSERLTELQHSQHGLSQGRIVSGKLYRGDPRRASLALTFDDGPVPIYTTLLLDTLATLNVRGTFFLIGRRVQQYPYFAKALVTGGHEPANHTFHHVNLTRVPPEQISQEISRAQQTITAVVGARPRYFRPPGGDYDVSVLQTARAQGLITVFWTDDPADYARPGTSVLEERLLGRVSNGGILLLHQGVEETIRLLPAAVHALRRRGFTIMTVTGLLKP